MTVNFWTFSKRRNSTKIPSIAADASFNCALKDASGVLRPVLEIYNSAAWNPSQLNYAYIADYQRYYFVAEWTYNPGVWECSLVVDPMASHKTEIGNEIKYVLRSSNSSNFNAIDNFYPTLSGGLTTFENTADFAFARSYQNGYYILGIANNDASGVGAVTYYTLTATQIRALVQYMLVGSPAAWLDPFNAMTDTLYRALYSPFDYIKSCKWFPYGVTPLNKVPIKFGNYTSTAEGYLLSSSAIGNTETRYLDLPEDWNSLEAKYRSAPNAQIFIHFNPFGTFEIDPSELWGYDQISLQTVTDFVSGDIILGVEAWDSSTHDSMFLCQKTAKLGIDINLSSASINAQGLLSGAMSLGAAAVTAVSGGATAPIAIAAAGGLLSAAEASVPTMKTSLGVTTNGAAALSGIAHLYYRCKQFANENNSEFGKPLYSAVQLSTIPGYIKCADGEISVAGYPDELTEISTYLVNGFFYE